MLANIQKLLLKYGMNFVNGLGTTMTLALVSVAIGCLIGAVVASVVTPIYFRLGQTKATQLLPTIIVMIFVLPVVFLGNSRLLDGALPGLEQISAFLAYIETPEGLAVGCAGMVAAAVAILAASAAISLKLYETREL